MVLRWECTHLPVPFFMQLVALGSDELSEHLGVDPADDDDAAAEADLATSVATKGKVSLCMGCPESCFHSS